MSERPSSFEAFFDAERGRLFGALCLMTGDRHEAEEVMQDAFLKLWERWDHLGHVEDLTAYLYRTAMNGFRSRRRRAALAVRRVAGRREASDAFAAVEDRDEVIRALRRVTPQQRAALVLTGLLDLSAEEAGRVLGVKPVTVRALASKARAAVREAAEEEA